MTSTRFDPARIRKQLLGVCGFEWALEDTFADVRTDHALASVSSANLSMAIECLLVGFEGPAKRLLERVSEWVQIAIAVGEHPGVYFRNGTEASWSDTQTLCTWLLLNRQDTAGYERFAEFEDRYIAEPAIARDKSEISLILPTYVDGEMYGRAIEIFEATPGLSPPTSTRVQGEARMSYVVSRHRLGLQYSPEEFEKTATRFLNRNVDYLFEQGQWKRVARWMKIIHWNGADPPISAKEALLKCYDYLPGREPPTQAGI